MIALMSETSLSDQSPARVNADYQYTDAVSVVGVCEHQRENESEFNYENKAVQVEMRKQQQQQ